MLLYLRSKVILKVKLGRGNNTYLLVQPQSGSGWVGDVEEHKCHQRIQGILPTTDSALLSMDYL